MHFVNMIANGRGPDMGKIWNPLIPVKQDKKMTPDLFKLAVLNSEPINEICRYYSGNDLQKEKSIRRQIKEVLDEIAFKRNMPVIRGLGILVTKLVLQFTAGVYVNESAILKVKNVLTEGKSNVMYLPSHRSYADFSLMSYACFGYDLEIPAIAAGMGKFLFDLI